jgi:hypothetical protein
VEGQPVLVVVGSKQQEEELLPVQQSRQYPTNSVSTRMKKHRLNLFNSSMTNLVTSSNNSHHLKKKVSGLHI